MNKYEYPDFDCESDRKARGENSRGFVMIQMEITSEGKRHSSHLQQIEYHNDVFPKFLGKRLTPDLI